MADVVDVGNEGRAAAVIRMNPPGVDFGSMADEVAAFDAIARKAREIGKAVADEIQPVGWRRADDVEGTISTMSALGLIFEELEALDQAVQLGREVEGRALAPDHRRRSI